MPPFKRTLFLLLLGTEFAGRFLAGSLAQVRRDRGIDACQVGLMQLADQACLRVHCDNANL